jgi:integrase
MASIRKLANGTFQATVFCGRDHAGKQIRRYATADTERECKALAREIERDLEDQSATQYRDLRFSAYAHGWLEARKAEISPSTYPSYKIYIDVHFMPHFGKYKLSQITEYMVNRYKAEKLERLSPTTVRKHLYVLQKMLAVLRDRNPVKYIEKPANEHFEAYVVSDAEFDSICKYFKGKPYEPIVLLAGMCGLRRGEICALKWSDVNAAEKTLTIDEALARTLDNTHVFKGPKSTNGYRTVSAPDSVLALLEKAKKKQKVIDERIFTQNPSTITDWFSVCMEKMGLPEIRLHDLRHYHATWLFEQGVPDIYAAQRLGDDVQTIKRVYQHARDQKRAEIETEIVRKQNLIRY